MGTFVKASTAVSGSLIGVILTGIAIIVALSDREFLDLINDSSNIYDRLLFIFEYAVILAFTVSILGILIQTVGVVRNSFLVFFFLFAHLILAVLRLLSTLITYGKKKAEYTAINNLDDVDPELDVPEWLKDQ